MAVILEAEAIFRARDASGAALAAMAGRFKEISRQGKLVGEAVGGIGRQIADMQGKLSRIDNFRALQTGLSEARTRFREAEREVTNLSRAMREVERPTRQMEAAYRSAQRAVTAASAAYREQAQAALQAKRGLEQAGVPVNRLTQQQDQLRRSIEAANSQMQRQSRMMANGGPWGSVARSGSGVPIIPRAPMTPIIPVGSDRNLIQGGAELGGGYMARRAMANIVRAGAEMDYSQRRQQAYAGATDEEQKNILYPQAKRIGQETKFHPIDITEAQTEIYRRLPADLQRAAVITPIIDNVKNYALATKGVDMEQSAQAVTGYLLSAGRDISTPEKAAAESRRATNLLIRAQKIGGMSHDDLTPFIQRGLSAARIAGMSEENALAFAIALRRSNISGDQAGTALRTASSKLVAPTQKGLAALASAGIRYDSYTKMPGGLSVDNLEGKFKQDFGKSFSPEVRERLAQVLNDEDLVSDRGAFSEAVTEAVSSLFTPKKDGTMRAADRAKVAKKVGEFHKFSVESVDVNALLAAIIAADPSLGVMNAMFTDKHGNKLGLLAKSGEQFAKDAEDLRRVPDNYGEQIYRTIIGGLGGALEELTGAVQNLSTSLGKANEGWLNPTLRGGANAIDQIANLPDNVLVFGTAALTAAGALMTLAGAARLAAFAGLPGAAAVSGGIGAAVGAAARSVPSLIRMGPAAAGGILLGGAIGTGMKNVFDVATGKHWTPDAQDVPALKAHLDELNAKIAGIEARAHPSMRGAFNPETDRLRLEAQGIQNRINAVQVSGEATLKNETKITVEPSPLFDVRMREIAKEEAVRVPLQGANGPGSTGVSMPEATAPSTGHTMGPR